MNKRRIEIITFSILFIILTILVKLNMLVKIDNYIYNLVTIFSNKSWDRIFYIITFLGSTIFIIIGTILLVMYFLYHKKKKEATILSIAIIIEALINNMVKLIIRRERPNVLALVTEKSFSYPSGHTMAAFTLCGILLYFTLQSNLKKQYKIMLGIFLIILPILVGISRIYLGVHFASDILGGIILSGIIILILVECVAKNDSL